MLAYLLFESDIFGYKFLLFNGLPYRKFYLFIEEGFYNVISSASLHSLHRRFNRGKCSHHNYRRVRAYLLCLFKHCHSINLPHLQVCKHYIKAFFIQFIYGIFTAMNRTDVIFFPLQQEFKRPAYIRLIVYYKNFRFHKFLTFNFKFCTLLIWHCYRKHTPFAKLAFNA